MKEALKDLLEAMEAAIKAGDWKVDGACDPDSAIHRAKKALALQALHDENERLDLYKEAYASPKDAALKLALEALEELNNTNSYWWQEVDRDTIDKINPAITAIKAALEAHKALAQPEQEPVAWGVDWGKDGQQSCVSIVKRKPNGGIEVVAIEYNPTPSPPQRTAAEGEDTRRAWVGLTDEEIWSMDAYTMAITDQETRWLYRFARAIESKLKGKNNGT